jgi:hypothetical protein
LNLLAYVCISVAALMLEAQESYQGESQVSDDDRHQILQSNFFESGLSKVPMSSTV